MVYFKKSVIYAFLIVMLCIVTYAEEDDVEIEEKNSEKEDDRFVATNEWQVVKEGKFFEFFDC